MSTWFTADLHLGHANMLRIANRPFETVGEMNDWLIDAINDRVCTTDTLWILGDFAFRVRREDVLTYRKRINCQHVFLVRGNHDSHFPDGASPFQEEHGYVDNLHSPKPNRRRLVLCHYPIMDWNGAAHGSIHLHGHIHASTSYNERNRARGILRYDVGVDANGYEPVRLEDVLGFFEGVEPQLSSIHSELNAETHTATVQM